MERLFETYPRLENREIVIRKLEIADVPALQKMRDEVEVYRYEPSFLPELQCESCERFITQECDRLFENGENIVLGVYLTRAPQTLVGLAELYGYVPARSKVSIGVRLEKSVWNRGIGSNVVSLLKTYILEEIGLQRITAHIMADNIGSVKAFQKNGFVQRRVVHEEDWGLAHPVMANKYVIYPPGDLPEP